MKNSYKSRGQGFTLIELLAVLVVLAIITLIAIPMVVNLINKARKQAYQRSVESYVRSVENAILEWSIDNPNKKYPSEKKAYNEYISIKGDQVTCVDFKVDEDTGKLTLGECTTDNSVKRNSDLSFKYEDGKVVEQNYEIFHLGDIVIFGQQSYHVITPSGKRKNYVVALKDEPLTVDEVNKYGSGHINKYSDNYRNEVYDTNGYGGMAYYSSITCGYDNDDGFIYDGCTTDYDLSDVKYVIDEWTSNLPTGLKEVNGYKSRLLEYNEMMDNLVEDKIQPTPSGEYIYKGIKYKWGYSSNGQYSYWIINNSKDDYKWAADYIGVSGHINNKVPCFSPDNVIRPVINVYKSAITKVES